MRPTVDSTVGSPPTRPVARPVEPPDARSAWRRLGPLPRVWPSQHKKGLSMGSVCARYAKMEKEPLVVRADMGTPYIPAVGDGALNLDGLLSAMVIESHPIPLHFPNSNEGSCVVPVPLDLAWASPEGLALWTTSLLRPDVEYHVSREYWHKRYPEDRTTLSTKVRANSRAGRNKEYRVPVQTVVTDTLSAECVGNREEIERLLSYCSTIGKKAGSGYGRVLRWTVEPLSAEMATDEVRQTCLRARNVPLRYLEAQRGADALKDSLVGGAKFFPSTAWTSPYWHAPWFEACVLADPDAMKGVAV